MLGRQLPVLAQRHVRGQSELLVVLPDGSKSLIPAAWTDLDDGDVGREARTQPGQAPASLADRAGHHDHPVGAEPLGQQGDVVRKPLADDDPLVLQSAPWRSHTSGEAPSITRR